LDALFEKGIPCLVLTRNHDASKELIECSQRYRIPILRTEDTTATFISSIVKYLNVELAPKTSLHGVLIEVYGEGILILGESGVGKSKNGARGCQARPPSDRG
jgi:HPr kinase/phosphorylase